jgi:hypothetical protein
MLPAVRNLPKFIGQNTFYHDACAFHVAIARAKARNKIPAETDSDLVFDLMSKIMLDALVFMPSLEPI